MTRESAWWTIDRSCGSWLSRRSPGSAKRAAAQALCLGLLLLAVALSTAQAVEAADPWIVTSRVVIDQATDRVGDIIVATGGELDVENVPSPGLRLTGNLLVIGSGVVHLADSVVQIMSTYNGEFFVAAIDQGTVTVSGCDYRVPNGVQHPIIAAGESTVTLEDDDFGSVQLQAAAGATLVAERLDGHFEVILQEAADLTLRDIPRDPDGGELWVWPEFPNGSRAVYTPPLPGFIESWSFPPPGATGFGQRCLLERCQVKLWPFLVQPGSDLTVRDVAPDNWVVVGLHLPSDTVVADLASQTTYADDDLGLADRRLVLENASIDTWNLYPEASAHVIVRDCLLGEALAMEDSRVTLERTTIDGSGGYFGVTGAAVVEADQSTFTCTVQVSHDGTALIHRSHVLPYPFDTTGQFTTFGAFDNGRLLLDATEIGSRATAGGSGLIGISGFIDPPTGAPGPSESVELRGIAALFSLDDGLLPVRWRVEAQRLGSSAATVLGSGEGNVENGPLATWAEADPFRPYVLRIVLEDAQGRELRGYWPVDGRPRVRHRLSGRNSAPLH